MKNYIYTNINKFILEMKVEFEWTDEVQEINLEKQTKIGQLERELFSKIINNLIDSNNIEKMNEFVDYLQGKIWLSLNQFIFQKIYKLENEIQDFKVDKIEIDYKDLDEKINSFKSQVEKLNNEANKKLAPLRKVYDSW